VGSVIAGSSDVMTEPKREMTPDERERFEREVLHHESPNAPLGPASETNPAEPTQPPAEYPANRRRVVDTEEHRRSRR